MQRRSASAGAGADVDIHSRLIHHRVTPASAHASAMTVLTGPARRWDEADVGRSVLARAELRERGISSAVERAHLKARRWQQLGRAIVLHNGPITRVEQERAALISCGPRAALTSFTAAARWGLAGWERDEIHVLVPAGTRRPAFPRLVMHRAVDWSATDLVPSRQLHRPAPSLALATEGLSNPRFACALFAAGVQQRLVTPPSLHVALDRWPKLRYHHALRLALFDIEQGAHALSEIDFVRLCRRYRLPPPVLQAVRQEPSGRRRYLDALWRDEHGRELAAEVDGALHDSPRARMSDELRQNEVVIGGTPVLRYSTVVLRCEEPRVADQLGRALYALHQ